MPFNSLRHETLSGDDVSKIQKSLTRKNYKNKTAVELMPLPSDKYQHLKAKSIDLEESAMLQKEHAEKLKEVQLKQAAEKLAGSDTNFKIGGLPFLMHSKNMAYREPKFYSESVDDSMDKHVENISEEESDEESCDQTENEHSVCVNSTVDDHDLQIQ